MALTLQKLRALFKRCRPDEPLAPGDDRLVDLDVTPDGRATPRGTRWVEKMVQQIMLADQEPQTILFSGLRGSGKTTELGRLAGTLAGLGYLPAVTNADAYVSLDQPIDLPDLLLPLLYGTELAIPAAGDAGGGAGALHGVVRWLADRDVSLEQFLAGLAYDWAQPAAVSRRFVGDLKTNAALRERVRKAASANVTGFREEVGEAFRALEARARATHPQGLVVILDSLEKLRGTGENDVAVRSSVQRLFTSSEQYLHLPVHALFTIPPELLFRVRSEVDFMPMVKITDVDGNRYEPGYAAMRALIERRVPPDDLRALFGADVGVCVERIIEASGGYPRELVRLLHDVILAAAPTDGAPSSDERPAVTPEQFEQVRRRAGDEVKRVVTSHMEAIDWLGGVAATHRLPMSGEQERAWATLMLAESVVFRYLNATEWWDLHPAVRGMFEVVAARERHLHRERAALPPREGRG